MRIKNTDIQIIKERMSQVPMDKEQIFFSEEEGNQFGVWSQGVGHVNLNFEKFIDEVLSPISPFEDKYEAEGMTKKNLALFEERSLSTGHSPPDFSSMDGDRQSQFSLMQEEDCDERKRKKVRPSNQNICKKYHTISNKILRKLKLYQQISHRISMVHKRNYFICILMLCKKAQKLDQFVQMYMKSTSDLAKKCEQILNSTFKGSKNYKYNQQLLQAIHKSWRAISKFKEGNLVESLRSLFDLKNMKRISWLDDAYKEVLQFGLSIQVN